MASIDELLVDLAAEQAGLDAVLDRLEPEDWHRPSSAAGWDVLDVVSHLCFFEEAAVLALTDPDGFDRHRSGLLASLGRSGRPDVAEARSGTPPATLRDRWLRARAEFAPAVASAAASGVRVPWYGPAMSPASFTTARLMEAFAHGTDIRDGVGAAIPVTPRLRHVCHLAYSARRFCFAAHGVDDPGTPIRMEATGPGAPVWAWGPEDAPERIRGPALDIALVWTQRRHPDRTAVVADGPTARRWVAIAQAFAGPPTTVAPDR